MENKEKREDPSMKKCFAAILALIILFALAACTTGEPGTQSPSAQDPAASSTPDTTLEETTEPSVEPETLPTYSVGDTADLGHWTITLDGFELTAEIEGDYSTVFYAEEGAKYGVVSLTVVNNDTSADTFLPSFSLGDDVRATIYSGEYTFSATSLLGHSDDMHDKFLNPLMSGSGLVAFQIPDTIADSTDPLTLTITCSGDEISFALR